MYISIIYISQRLNVANYLQSKQRNKTTTNGKEQKHFIILGTSFKCCCEPTKRISL